jgi:type VI secretion system protein ImpC
MKETGNLQEELDRWIKNYVCLKDNPTEDEKAKLPLAEARVEVVPVPGKLGAFDAKIWMRPWTQLRELTAAMSMVTRIPKAAGS